MRRTITSLIAWLLLTAPASAQSVTLAWDASVGLRAGEIGTYVVGVGAQPGQYVTLHDVGNVTQATVPLTGAGTYYFAVKACLGLDPATRLCDGWSTEVSAVVAQLPSASSDGSTVPPAAQIVDAALTRWTIDVDGRILRDGVHAAGGKGELILWWNGNIYVQNVFQQWFQFAVNSWTQITGDPRPTTAPPPPVTPPAPGAPTITITATQCRYLATATPPDATSGWRAQFRRDGGNFGQRDSSVPYQQSTTVKPGPYVFDVVWSKSNGATRTTAAVTVKATCD